MKGMADFEDEQIVRKKIGQKMVFPIFLGGGHPRKGRFW